MIFAVKDLIKLLGISVVCFCAVFVCTFFLNFYFDVSALQDIPAELEVLYNAQLSMARFTCAITGGFLGLTAVVMLVFYVKLYINSHLVQLGTLKSMGYSDFEISRKFWVFGLSVLAGTVLGYAAGHAIMPYVYETMLINGLPECAITYHPSLLFALVIAPTALYALLSCLFAYASLKKPVGELLRGRAEKVRLGKDEKGERSFLKEMFFKCVSAKKLLAFFITLGAFCFSAMVQMGFSMKNLTEGSMAELILGIGLVLAAVCLIMSITSLVNANAENVSIMKAFGYSLGECTVAVFGGYAPFVIFGFVLGTVYQFGLLSLMVNLFFKDVAGVGEYSFDLPLMFITLAAFITVICLIMFVCVLKLGKISVKQVANE